jgi:hypothetical protein
VNPEITGNLTGIMSLQPPHSGQLRIQGSKSMPGDKHVNHPQWPLQAIDNTDI